LAGADFANCMEGAVFERRGKKREGRRKKD